MSDKRVRKPSKRMDIDYDTHFTKDMEEKKPTKAPMKAWRKGMDQWRRQTTEQVSIRSIQIGTLTNLCNTYQDLLNALRESVAEIVNVRNSNNKDAEDMQGQPRKMIHNDKKVQSPPSSPEDKNEKLKVPEVKVPEQNTPQPNIAEP